MGWGSSERLLFIAHDTKWQGGSPAGICMSVLMNRQNFVLVRIDLRFAMAVEVGFEPTVPCGTTVFKTAAFDHSATPPYCQDCGPRRDSSPCPARSQDCTIAGGANRAPHSPRIPHRTENGPDGVFPPGPCFPGGPSPATMVLQNRFF